MIKNILILILTIMITTSCSVYDLVGKAPKGAAVGYNSSDCRSIERMCYSNKGTYTYNIEWTGFDEDQWMCSCVWGD